MPVPAPVLLGRAVVKPVVHKLKEVVSAACDLEIGCEFMADCAAEAACDAETAD